MAGLAVALLVIVGWAECRRLAAKILGDSSSGPHSLRCRAALRKPEQRSAQEYFTDGMTDALVTELAQISSLRVISRTSLMRYKGTRKTLPDTAKELNADGIVEGKVFSDETEALQWFASPMPAAAGKINNPTGRACGDIRLAWNVSRHGNALDLTFGEPPSSRTRAEWRHP